MVAGVREKQLLFCHTHSQKSMIAPLVVRGKKGGLNAGVREKQLLLCLFVPRKA